MLTTITLIFSFLVALIFFLLLKFSCNKTIQRKSTEKPLVIEKRPTVVTTPQLSNQLAQTGS